MIKVNPVTCTELSYTVYLDLFESVKEYGTHANAKGCESTVANLYNM